MKPSNVPTEIVLTKHVYQVSDGSGEVGAARITSEVLEVMIKVNTLQDDDDDHDDHDDEKEEVEDNCYVNYTTALSSVS